jgi:hypothetical protein
LADGRLDEAFEIAKAGDVGRHRHGQRLIGRLVRLLLKRGQENLAAGSLQPAMGDCSKAEALAGNQSEVARLRAAINAAVLKQQQGHQQDAYRVAQAKQHVDQGWLSVGERILGSTPGDNGHAQRLRQELAAMRVQTEDALAKARGALKQGDLETAIDIARGAGLGQSQNGDVAELLRQIRACAGSRVRVDFEHGRIDRAETLIKRVSLLGENGSELGELKLSLIQCHQAAEHVAGGQPALALPLLRKAKTICPSAKWLDAAIANVRRAAEALDEVDAGPLGLTLAGVAACQELRIAAGEGRTGAPGTGRHRRGPEPEQQMPELPGDTSVPSGLVMKVDGVGSFLVFRQSRITVGPVSSSARPTLGLVADPNSPVVTIERVDGDYFLRSHEPVEVNGQSVTERLLSDGDRIALSPRCRLRFHIPNPASATAVLMLSGARLNRPDVRCIVLMDRDILAGPYTNNHIRTEQLDETVTIFAQNGRLLCRTHESVSVNDRPFDPNVGLPLDKHIKIGKLSMVVARLVD